MSKAVLIRRQYPRQPIVGVGGVVISGDRVLLIRRGKEPLKGKWSIPGGMVELGETLAAGVRREIKEETGLEVEPLDVISMFDRIQRNRSRVQYHYVIIDYVCRRKRGRLSPATDVVDARWVKRSDLSQYQLSPKAAEVIAAAFRLLKKRQRRLQVPRT